VVVFALIGSSRVSKKIGADNHSLPFPLSRNLRSDAAHSANRYPAAAETMPQLGDSFTRARTCAKGHQALYASISAGRQMSTSCAMTFASHIFLFSSSMQNVKGADRRHFVPGRQRRGIRDGRDPDKTCERRRVAGSGDVQFRELPPSSLMAVPEEMKPRRLDQITGE